MAPGAALALANNKNAIFNSVILVWLEHPRQLLGFDMASNTAYGPLIGHMDINADLGNGIDSPRGQ